MDVRHSEKALNDPACELRIGGSSWDESQTSMKYTWFTSNNAPARGGEFPIEVLPQMVTMAIKHGYLQLQDIFRAVRLAIKPSRTQMVDDLEGSVSLRDLACVSDEDLFACWVNRKMAQVA
jgi:hypothetical protein